MSLFIGFAAFVAVAVLLSYCGLVALMHQPRKGHFDA